MARSISDVRMVPASEDDTINPGSFYFGCLNLQRKTDPDSYWIVLRAPREWLPDGFFDTRPVQLRVFPFWIVGKDQRVWLPRSSLFNLDRSQREIFAERPKRHEFANTFMLIDSFKDLDGALIHYKRKILESTRQYNERRERVDRTVAQNRQSRSISPFPGSDSVEFSCAAGSKRKVGSGSVEVEAVPGDGDLMLQNRDSATQLKRRRLNNFTTPKNRTSAILNKEKATSKTKPQDKALASPPESTIMSGIQVRIFVGQPQQIMMADLGLIQRKSSLMASWIESDPQGKYIKWPNVLDKIDPDDMKSVLEYMENRDYTPRSIGRGIGGIMAWDPIAFIGCEDAADYEKVLMQSARMYCLAKKLAVSGLDKHVYRRVKVGGNKISDSVWIQFAKTIWARPFGVTLPLERGASPSVLGQATLYPASGQVYVPVLQAQYPHGNQQIGYEPVDEWTVLQLGARFGTIVKDQEVLKEYLDMVESKGARERMVHAAILEEAALHYRAASYDTTLMINPIKI